MQKASQQPLNDFMNVLSSAAISAACHPLKRTRIWRENLWRGRESAQKTLFMRLLTLRMIFLWVIAPLPLLMLLIGDLKSRHDLQDFGMWSGDMCSSTSTQYYLFPFIYCPGIVFSREEPLARHKFKDVKRPMKVNHNVFRKTCIIDMEHPCRF